MSAAQPIYVVAGSTRCGTSLVMGMLHAGGIEPTVDGHVAYEDRRVLDLPKVSAWLDECAGRAVKMLEPLHFRPPAGRRYRFILMRRDPVQQARSQVKFMRLVSGFDLTADAADAIARSLVEDQPKMRRTLGRMGPVLELAFEDVLADPARAARQIAAFLGVPLDVEAMARRVRPRSPECLTGMLELDLIDEAERATA